MPSRIYVPVVIIILFVATSILSISSYSYRALYHDILSDDAYYYIIAASNYIKYGFYTFDTINPTNGFHPLLMWIETLYIKILNLTQSDRYQLYLSIIGLNFGLFFTLISFTTFYIYRSIKKQITLHHCYITILIVTYLLVFKLAYYFNGMESVLLIIISIPLIFALIENKTCTVSILSALLVAARLDTAPYFLFPLFLAYLCYRILARQSVSKAIKECLVPMIPTLLFIIFYGLFCYVNFGYLTPISGALKSTFPAFNPQFYLIFKKDQLLFIIFSIVGMSLLLNRYHLSDRAQIFGFSLGLVAISYLLNFYLFQKWSKPIPPWYLSAPYIAGVSCIFLGFGNVLNERSLQLFTLLFLSISLIYMLNSNETFAQNADDNFHFANSDTVTLMKSLDPDQVFAYTDCGSLSFWSNRKIINLDGLMNNFEYQSYLKDRNLIGYLKAQKVRYLIAGIWSQKITRTREYEPMYKYRVSQAVFKGEYDKFPFFVYSYLYNNYSDNITLLRNAEIWRSSIYLDEVEARYLIFDLNKAT